MRGWTGICYVTGETLISCSSFLHLPKFWNCSCVHPPRFLWGAKGQECQASTPSSERHPQSWGRSSNFLSIWKGPKTKKVVTSHIKWTNSWHFSAFLAQRGEPTKNGKRERTFSTRAQLLCLLPASITEVFCWEVIKPRKDIESFPTSHLYPNNHRHIRGCIAKFSW